MQAKQRMFVRAVNQFTKLVREYGEENAVLFEAGQGRAEVVVDSPAGNQYYVPIRSKDDGSGYIEIAGETFPLDRRGLFACMFLQADRHQARLRTKVSELKHAIF